MPSGTTPSHPFDTDPFPGDDDHALLDRVRAGDHEVFGVLYARHHAAVLRAALAIAGPARAEDLVADAFTRTFALVREGRGPERALRAYLVSAVRNRFFGMVRKESRAVPHDEPESLGADEVAPAAAEEWAAIAERELVTAALGTLPDRWRAVLWLTAVEMRSLDEVGEILAISPRAAAQLAFRAREALRIAYLTEHVQVPDADSCREAVPLLARRERGTVSDRGTKKLDHHLAGCAPCAEAGAEIGGLVRELAAGRV